MEEVIILVKRFWPVKRSYIVVMKVFYPSLPINVLIGKFKEISY
jgi:hypothetical protein